jgi:DUF1365 family protein
MQSSIFVGQVSHSRKSPLAHAFNYRVFMAYLDLGELDTVFRGRWFWSTRRPALARFRREDHFGDPDKPLDVCVRDLVHKETGYRPDGPIRLLTNLAYFGYCFNPISIYYCFDESGTRLTTVVAEVTNTPWGERCCYVLADYMNTGDAATHRYRTRKQMHVSPFMEMDIDYDWLVTQPSDDLVVRINNKSANDSFFNATLVLKRQEMSGRTMAGVLLRYPFMTLKVMFGIHWQAFRLWLKGCPVQTHPDKSKSIQATQ